MPRSKEGLLGPMCSNSVVNVWAYSNSLSALPRRWGLKQHWRTGLKSSLSKQQWHPWKFGNAIQAVERSTVTITYSGGERKLGSAITNCFQILSPSKLLLKLSADTDTVFAESYVWLWSAGRTRTVWIRNITLSLSFCSLLTHPHLYSP